ncbi:MAG: hypothetical protein ABJC26_14355 [Gemmatimonadaceae bacterium]
MKNIPLLNVVILLTAAACSSPSCSFINDSPIVTATSTFGGIVTDAQGNPLQSVRIGIGMPATYLYGPAFTDAKGNFIVRLARIGGPKLSPDTVRAQ